MTQAKSRTSRSRDGDHKAYRILNLEAYLLDHPEGASKAEIAQHFGVHRTTVYRDLADISQMSPISESADGRLRIDRQKYLVNVRFTLHEAMAMHLASRLLATRMDRRNLHAAAALRKLGAALEKLAPMISRQMSLSAEAMDAPDQWSDPAYVRALETLTEAWAAGQRVRLQHRQERTGALHEYDFEPYFIEPYAIGQTTHVIGWCIQPDALRTFKVERIAQVELLDQAYTIPEDFDPLALLEDAWGIWFTDGEPVEVVLRFSPRVAGQDTLTFQVDINFELLK